MVTNFEFVKLNDTKNSKNDFESQFRVNQIMYHILFEFKYNLLVNVL